MFITSQRIKIINLALPAAVNNHSVSIRCRNSPSISGKYFQQFVEKRAAYHQFAIKKWKIAQQKF